MSYLEEYLREQSRRKKQRFSERMGFVPMGSHNVGKSDWATAMAMAIAAQYSTPKYIVGIDPITEGGESLSFTGSLTKELETKTETKMKTKRFYHDFEFEDRDVTLCLLVEEQPQTLVDRMSGRAASATVKVGYSVCVPTDDFDQDLAKRISSGRAESDKARLESFSMDGNAEFLFDLGILNASARIFERKIKRGEVVIKGIRPLTKED